MSALFGQPLRAKSRSFSTLDYSTKKGRKKEEMAGFVRYFLYDLLMLFDYYGLQVVPSVKYTFVIVTLHFLALPFTHQYSSILS